MNTSLRILLINNSSKDQLLIQSTLKHRWPELVSKCVGTDKATREALESHHWDCVVSEMSTTGIGAQEAIDTLIENDLRIPLIVVSGVVDFEEAIKIMRAGAHDFVRKDNLGRLIPSIENAIAVCKNKIARAEAGNSLVHREATLRTISRIAKIGGWEMNAKTGVVDWTSEVFHIFGVPEGDTPAFKRIMGLFPPEEGLKLQLAINKALENGTPYDLELQLVRADGRKIWTHSSCECLVEDGSVVRLTGSFQDITAEKKCMQKLEAVNERHRNLVESLPISMHEISAEGQVLSMNRVGLEMMDIARKEDLIGKPFLDLMPAKDRAHIENSFKKCLKGEPSRFNYGGRGQHA